MKGQSLMPQSARGQATMEYMLVMLVTVMILLGAFYQLNQSFRSWVSNYYGEYLACLLETGELPSLGYEGEQGLCDDEFVPFTLAGGRPPRSGSGSGGGGDGNAGGSGESNRQGQDGSQANSGAAGRLRVRPGGGTDGTTTIAANGPELMEKDSGRRRRVPLSNQDRANQNGRGSVQFDGSNVEGSLEGSSGRQGRFVPAGEEASSVANQNQKKPNVPAPQADDDKVRRVPAETEKKKKSIEKGEEWSLPDFLKFIIIAGIIIAMVVFFGGQAIQISKGREK